MTAAVLDVARSWLGTKEDPAGSNHCGITEWYADTSGLEWTRRGNPWCDMSVSKWLSDAGLPTLYCYCPTHVNAFKLGTAGSWIGGGDPQPGDVVFFDWNHDGIADHVGLVEVVNNDGTVTTIEGNVADAVRRQIRTRAVILGFGRPHYTQEDDDLYTDDDRKLLQDVKNLLVDDKVGVIPAMAQIRAELDDIKAKVDAPVDELRRNVRRVGKATNAQGIEGTV